MSSFLGALGVLAVHILPITSIRRIYPESRLAIRAKTMHSPRPFARRLSLIQSFPCP